MSDLFNAPEFAARHAASLAPHAICLREAQQEVELQQSNLFSAQLKEAEVRLARESIKLALAGAEGQPASAEYVDLTHRILADRRPLSEARMPAVSRVAAASALQPVRDLKIEGILVFTEDRKLEIIGAPYPEVWTDVAGRGWLSPNRAWAEKTTGVFGFDVNVAGSVDGKLSTGGAGVYVHFVPPLTPGIAQVRPLVPFTYQYFTMSFKSREDSWGSFGVRVWSRDFAGGVVALEQDYTYKVWNATSMARYFAETHNPSAYDPPGWDDGHALNFTNAAPYFKTSPNRVYIAAIWCSGLCWSVSPENRPGTADGRLNAQLPWVVIGYQ